MTARMLLVAVALLGSICLAQDSNYSPNDQQIPLPGCVSVAVKDLWFPGSKLCAPARV